MGLDSTWWLVDPEALKREYPSLKTLGEFFPVLCALPATSDVARRMELPVRNDNGFLLGLLDWKSISPSYKAFARLSLAERIPWLKERHLGFGFDGTMSIALANGIEQGTARIFRPYWVQKNLPQVLKSLGLTKGEGREGIAMLGTKQLPGLAVLARMAQWELHGPSAGEIGAQSFRKYLEIEDALRFLRVVAELPVEARRVLVTYTI